MSYELFYSSGGHGGPYFSLDAALERAKLIVRSGVCSYVEIKERTATGIGGYGRVVETIGKDTPINMYHGRTHDIGGES